MSNLREVLNTWDNADSELNKKIDNTNLSTIVASATASATNSKTIEINGTGKAVEKLVVEGKTEQNGTPSPDNPIEVKGVGDKVVNLFDNQIISGLYKSVDGTYEANNGYICSKEMIQILPDFGEVTFTTEITYNGRYYILEYDKNRKFIKASGSDSVNDSFIKATLDSRARYINIEIGNSNNPPSIAKVGNFVVTIDKDVYKIPISSDGKSQNVYLNAPLFDGEKADLVGGTVDKKYEIKVFDGSENWTVYSSSSMDFKLDNAVPSVAWSTTTAFGDSNKYKAVSQDFQWASSDDIISISSSGQLFLKDSRYNRDETDLAKFKAELATNPLVIIYKINSTKETFEAAELPTSVGKNIISVNTDVIPAKVEAVTFGDYYSKAEVDKKFENALGDYDIVPLTGSTGVTIIAGGYTKIGKLIIVNVRFSVSTANKGVAVSLASPGVPKPKTLSADKSYISASVMDIQSDAPSLECYGCISRYGALTASVPLADHAYSISATYICD